MSPDLSIIIVSWNVKALLRDCLHSIAGIRDSLDLQLIVVDSASTDDSVPMIHEEFAWVNMIACRENVGFPKGNNIGLKHAAGRYVLFLNPDTIVLGDALQRMIAYLDAHDDVGVIGPQLLNSDGSVQSSRRRFPTFWTGVFESTWLQSTAPKPILTRYYMADLPANEVTEVDWLMGAAMMTRREVVQAVGGMDVAYFMYSEELDYCRRIKDAGWRIVYLPEAKITHYSGASSEQASTARHINFQRAKLRYFRKFQGRMPAFLLRLILLANYIGQIIVEGCKGLVGHKRPLRRQRVAAYWQVVRTGLPPAGYDDKVTR